MSEPAERSDPFFDVRELKSGRAPPVRPKPAAALILVRWQGNIPQFLLGKRHQRHAFMPQKFVFPGGRVSYADHRVKTGTALPDGIERVIARETGPPGRAYALAAIREAFEETGFILGRPGKSRRGTRSPEWKPFLDLGVEPDLNLLRLVARAVTPPPLPKRFDTWFFLADTAALAESLPRGRPSGELQDLTWVSPTEAQDLDLPSITRQVIRDATTRLSEPRGRTIPYYRFVNGQPRISRL